MKVGDEPNPAAGPAVGGLTNPHCLALERSAVRTRGSSVTLSAWRLAVDCEEGQGALVLVEGEDGQTIYRGEGVFLGWPPDRLAAAYRELLPRGSDPEPDPGQFG